ncbi:family 20 glycosylhydrolase [Nonomuraea sp. NN258]|uniref:beta-N-acetylhexosaminidase n=1 Tax=Nonomuraea antri TaxID=2730852 RepID=UPI001568ECBA|nr:beta-N-acetylhexosaminidase [Nonomuraea antri]NRQ37506.1 family 20 glycosylhydrolase [Nonomuraea antri]
MTALVPTPHTHHPGTGRLRLADTTTISAGAGPLLPELRSATGLRLPETDGVADIALVHRRDLAPESYRLSVADRVTVAAADDAGAFYGLQTVLKLLAGRELPKGVIEDGPAVRARGVMLDLGRRHWSPDYLRGFVRRMAWLGYNRLQLHLTEWNGFRIRLPGFEDLATEPAYEVAEVTDLIDYAQALHIEVVPEIDLPAHATAVIERRPGLRPADAVLNDGSTWTGSPTPSWTMDITRPENREWIKELLGAFCDAFPAVERIHIGGDEWPVEPALSQASSLLAYARSLHPGYRPTDALVAFVNELAGVVRERGKQPELWNWWEHASHGDYRLRPDTDTRVTVWEAAERDLAGFTKLGYHVIASPSTTHYVTPRTAPGNRPGVNYVTPDARFLYEEWNPSAETLVDGYQLCVWADWAEEQDDAYFDWYARRPLEVLADRMWGGPRLADVDAYLDAVDAQPLPGGGPPYRVVPGSDGVPARLARVRFRPRVPEGARAADGKWPDELWQALEAVRGTHFQGAPGPDGPWVDLAVVTWLPAPTWNVLTVEDRGTFARFRAVGAPDGLDIEWWGDKT